MGSQWLVRLDPSLSSYSILATLVAVVALAVALQRVGVLGLALGLFGRATRGAIRAGFRVWEVTLSWADWWVYLLLSLGLIAFGALTAGTAPVITLGCAALTLSMGVATCLAYMFIDVERYEVERGRKAVYNPLKGQDLATNVARYGHRVEVTLLGAAAVGVVAGFALLNQAVYETFGATWYRLGDKDEPRFAEFLTYALVNLLSLVDVLDLADSRHVVHTATLRKGTWQAGVMLAAFRSFFTLVVLQQVFASVRKGRLLSETIADFWSPHEPIHDRARSALPQFGASAIGPVLRSLREMSALTKEQRDQLPAILAAIGPVTVPALLDHLTDAHEHVRAVVAGALGHLQAREAIPDLAALVADPSELVRTSAVEALGAIAAAGGKVERAQRVRLRLVGRRRLFFRRRVVVGAEQIKELTATAVAALRGALADGHPAVRGLAATALGQCGAAAADSADALAALLRDADETVRGCAAEALGHVGGPPERLAPVLDDPAAAVRAAAARGLKALGRRASAAVPRLVELLQDRDDVVRAAAADALNAIGPLDNGATHELARGLSSADTTVRAHVAEALGTVDAPAEHAAPPLVAALTDRNDNVRAKAAEALGKIGEAAAAVAVPGLVRALSDRDSWVSALAAEALGGMGCGTGVVAGLVRALGHVNPEVRANAAEALGKLGAGAGAARAALERAAADVDGHVRARAVAALGALGPPPADTAGLIRAALADPDPVVRAGAAAAVGAWPEPPADVLAALLPLLGDPNDEVKVAVCAVLATGGPGEPVIEGLCRVLAEDGSTWVQGAAAVALGRLGPPAAAAGSALLRAARTAEADVREQAMRALVMVQPPEAAEAFTAGLTDAAPEVRLVASAGWMRAAVVPEAAGPALVEALRDPEPQVRANAAHALARLEALPPGAVAALRECAADTNDGIRLNAALALRVVPPGEVAELMDHLLEDPNVRVRLVAAGAVLRANPADARAAAVVHAAADDPSPRVQQAVEELRPLIAAAPVEPGASPDTPAGAAAAP
jgi:HEAT repeat protein